MRRRFREPPAIFAMPCLFDAQPTFVADKQRRRRDAPPAASCFDAAAMIFRHDACALRELERGRRYAAEPCRVDTPASILRRRQR